MTIKEALIAVLRVNLPDNSLEKALLDQGITGSSTYTAADAKAVDYCAMDLLLGLLSEPDVSEGGYSVKYDRAAVLNYVKSLAKKHGREDILKGLVPTVTSKSVW